MSEEALCIEMPRGRADALTSSKRLSSDYRGSVTIRLSEYGLRSHSNDEGRIIT
jgi:hypothetical protein